MTSTATTPCPDAVPARAGTLGIGTPPAPLEFLLNALERATGHEVELRYSEAGEQWIVWDEFIGDAMGEGRTRIEAVSLAVENFL
jgi:hypothetical protein